MREVTGGIVSRALCHGPAAIILGAMNRFAASALIVAAAAGAAAGPPPVPPPGFPQPGRVFVPPPPRPRQPPVVPFLFTWQPLLIVFVLLAQQAEQARREEEEDAMTPTGAEAVEYKFLRSGGAFKDAAKFRAILAAEAAAGWELHEKFDDSRVRLRRAVSWRDRDAELGWDAYRTKAGPSDAAVALKIIGIVVAVCAVIAAVVAAIFALK